MASYDKGTVVRLATTAKVGGTTLTDPTTIRLLVYKLPATGSISTLLDETQAGATGGGSITRSATGTYYADITTAYFPKGSIYYRWVGTGTAEGSATNTFTLT